jgi:hypothetical protein
VSPSQAATLTAAFQGGDGVVTPGSLGLASGAALSVTPGATTEYTLTVTNAAGDPVTARATVTVTASVGSSFSFPSAYLPKGPHPRIWLTAERLATLRQARDLNTPAWQRFKARADSYMDPDQEGWAQWVGYCEAIPYLGLMYQLGKDPAYARRALACARKAELAYPANEERYWIRNGGYLAFAYDWIHDALTPDERAEVAGLIATYDGNLWNVAHYGGSRLTYTAIDTDRVTKGGADHLLMGCALYGDDPRGGELLDRAWWTWARGNGEQDSLHQSMRPSPIRRWIRDALGGTYYTGLGYAMNTDTAGLSFWFTTLRTACGMDLYAVEPDFRPFWRNMIRSTLDQIAPDRETLHNMGDWQDPAHISERNWFYKYLALMAWEADQAGDADWAARARGVADRVTSWHSDPFVEFVFSSLPQDPAHPAADPWAGDLPPVRRCQGVDMLYFRTGWSTADTWGTFSGQGGEPTDHQSEDTGSFSLWRNGTYLTGTATGYRDFLDACMVHNTPSLDNGRTHGSPRLQAGEKKAFLERASEHNDAPLFAYAMLNADGQWNLDPAEYSDDRLRDAPVLTYRRHFFWSGDDVVVFDRLRAKRVLDFRYRLRSPSRTAPTLDAARGLILQTGADGHQRLAHRTLLPQTCAFTLEDEQLLAAGLESYQWRPEARGFQVLIAPPASDKVNLLHVMRMGDDGLAAMDDAQLLQSAESVGASTRSWAVVFAAEETLRSSARYSLPVREGSQNQLVCDLQPGLYLVSAGLESVPPVRVADGNNTAFFSLAAGPAQEVSLDRVAD